MNLGFSVTYIALWAIVIFQGLLALALLKQLSELRESLTNAALSREDGLPIGSLAPNFSAFDEDPIRELNIGTVAGARILLFLSGECSVCKDLVESLRSESEQLAPIVAVCLRNDPHDATFEKRFGPEVMVLFEGAANIAAKYRVSSFPTAVIIDGQRKIRAYGHPTNKRSLQRLLTEALGSTSADLEPDESLTVTLSGSGRGKGL